MPEPRFVKLVLEPSGTVTQTSIYQDGRVSEVNYPSLDFWVLEYVKNGMSTSDDLEIRGLVRSHCAKRS